MKRTPLRILHCVAAAVGLLLNAAPVQAQANIITPVSATSTTTIGGSRTITAAIDGTLLSSGGTSGDILSETVTNAGNAGHWLSASSAVDDDANFRSTTEVLTFDLGGSHDVSAFHLWPYVRAERNRGLSSFDIAFSSDGVSYSPTITLSGFTIGPGSTTGEPVQTQTFATQSGVTHIRMTNLTTFGSTSYIAIAELRFGSPDVTAPTIDSTDPADGATGVVVGSDLVATFDENIALVDGGTITIRNLGPSTDPDEVITLPDPARVSVSGMDLVINPGSDLDVSNNYAVRISGDAIEDLAPSPNAFAGILDDTMWNFETAADATAPGLVLPTTPADDATGVATDTLLVATFDEPVVAGSGDITIKNLSEGTDTVIAVGDAQVSVSGTQLTVDPATNLDPGDDYAIQLDAGVVTDTSGNAFAGILDPDVTTWNFTTAADTTNPTILSLSPADDSSGVADTTDLVATFDEAVVAAVQPPVGILTEGFEAGDGGFTEAYTEGSHWVRGTPDSLSPGGTIDSGNGAASGTGNCWGTNLGAYAGGTGDEGYYDVPTTTCLRSAPINLTGVVSATLVFAQARDLAAGDTAVVNLIDDTTDALVESAIYTAPSDSAGWSNSSAIDLAAGVGDIVRIEWCLTGTGGGSNDYLGWYIDDVTVTGTASADNSITLKNLSENTETVFALDDPGVSIVGNTLTIVPDTVLDSGDDYAVRIGTDALTDLSGNPFAGILDDTSWNFTVAAGSVVITPSAATATSTIGGSRTIERTIDGSDLSAGGTSGDILSETHTNNDSNGGGYWLSASTGGNVAGEVLTFTLAAASDVNAVHIWGYRRSGSTARSIKNFDLSFSTDGGATYPNTISLGDLVGPGDPIAVQTLAFPVQSGVTDLRITNITNFGDGNYVGLSEIRFGGPGSGPGGNDFSDWIALYPGVGAQTGIDDDPDGDGNDNGVENFFGTAPDAFSQGLVAGTVDTGANTFTFTHPLNATPADDLTATYRWSKDLQTFYADGASDGDGTKVDFTVQLNTPAPGTTTVTATVSGTVIPDKLFVDVAVTQN